MTIFKIAPALPFYWNGPEELAQAGNLVNKIDRFLYTNKRIYTHQIHVNLLYSVIGYVLIYFVWLINRF